MRKISFVLLLALIALSSLPIAFADEVDLSNSASSACVMDKDSGRVLYAKNEDYKLPMASTTKIITAIVAIENANLDNVITITKDCVGIEGSSVYLKEGERWTIRDLLYGLMLRSGNDCAVALAKAISGNIEQFVSLMNSFVKSLGCTNTNLTNPHGLHNDNHYSTAYDLAKICCYALQNNIFSQIVSSKKYSTKIDGVTKVFVNKNKLLYSWENCDGIKTGYTKKAGRCFVGSATENDRQFVCVVLNDGPMFEDCRKLISSCLAKYKYTFVIPTNKLFVEYVDSRRKVYKISKGFYLPICIDDRIQVETDFDNRLVKVFVNDELFDTISISLINQ